MGSWIKPNACSTSKLFPPEAVAPWEKGHQRLERRRVARLAVTPEEIGFCGCWQVIKVERVTIDLSQPKAPPTVVIAYYVTSLTEEPDGAEELGQIIRGHWSAIENGTHYRRDVTLGEDACTVRERPGAEALATLRNLANGIYELERAHEQTKIGSLKSWCQQQVFGSAWKALNR